MIDEEVRKLIEEAEKAARKILTECSDDLETIAQALLEYETLSGDEVNALLRGESIVRSEDMDIPPEGGHKSSVPSSGKAKKSKGAKGSPGIEPEPQPES